MTHGLQLLHSILQAQAQTAFRQCMPLWFTPEETPVYEFIATHLNRHGRLPDPTTIREAGIGLPRATEPPPYYLERVRNRAIWAQLEALGPAFLEAVRHRNMEGAMTSLRSMLQNTQAVNPSSSITSIQEQGRNVLEQYAIAHRTFRLIGVTLGWDCVDAVTEGGHPGDVVILVGRPNVGKTYGLLWMLKKAWMSGSSVLIASMEMSAEQITRRVIGLQSGLNPQYIRKGRLTSWGENLMRNTVEGFDDMPPLNILAGDFRKSVGDINKAAQELQPDIIFIDGGYLLTPEKGKASKSSRREVISDVIEELKMIAIDRRRPLVTSVQFNREIKRKQRGPLELGAIAETDVIAQVATIVLGLRHGDSPHEMTTRRWELIKNRDGDLINFETNFGFAPVDFSFTRMLREASEEDGEETVDAPDLSHMA